MKTAVDLRFSASYAARYHGCHASANLEDAIPGFEFRKKEWAKARSGGSALHLVLDAVLTQSTSIPDAVLMLRYLGDVHNRGKAKPRYTLLTSEKDYLIWWFMKEYREPAIEHEHLLPLAVTKDESGNDVEHMASPKQIRFLADAAEYVFLIMQQAESRLYTEYERKATWLESSPTTTVDIMIRQPGVLHIMDYKSGTTPVEVMENAQLLYYALTNLKDEERIILHILQEGNIVSWEITREYLLKWGEALKQSEKDILAGDLTFNMGNHCGFCPANPQSRGDKGYPFCPVRLELLYGVPTDEATDSAVIMDMEEEWMND